MSTATTAHAIPPLVVNRHVVHADKHRGTDEHFGEQSNEQTLLCDLLEYHSILLARQVRWVHTNGWIRQCYVSSASASPVNSTSQRTEPAAVLPMALEELGQVRRELFTWMLRVSGTLKLLRVTTHRAFAYVDQMMRCCAVCQKRLRTLGLVCLWIASKIEEKHVFELEDAHAMQGSRFRQRDFLCMERLVCRHLTFQLHAATACEWLQLFHSTRDAERTTPTPLASPTAANLRSLRMVDEVMLDIRACSPHSPLDLAAAIMLAAGLEMPRRSQEFCTVNSASSFASTPASSPAFSSDSSSSSSSDCARFVARIARSVP